MRYDGVMTLDLTHTYVTIYEALLAELAMAIHGPVQHGADMIATLRNEVALARLQAYGERVA
jgi:hypothetical protein